MGTHGDQPVTRREYIRQGETIKLQGEDGVPQEITCDDVARLALRMHDHAYFFVVNRDLSFRFSRDLNGSGTQGLDIRRKGDERAIEGIIFVVFDYSYKKDIEFLYEADLIMDRGKDYEPTVNKGKHPFVAQSAAIQIDWNGSEANQWRSDLARLSQSPATLTEWVEADLEMLVRCGDQYCYRQSAILSKDDLKKHIADGTSLDDLKTRLRCSKCRKRGARVLPF